MIATAGSPDKTRLCLELGADIAINYREDDFDDVVAKQTDGAGVDVILDNMGASYLPRNVIMMCPPLVVSEDELASIPRAIGAALHSLG